MPADERQEANAEDAHDNPDDGIIAIAVAAAVEGDMRTEVTAATARRQARQRHITAGLRLRPSGADQGDGQGQNTQDRAPHRFLSFALARIATTNLLLASLAPGAGASVLASQSSLLLI